MGFLNNMSLRSKLFLLIALPLAFLFYFTLQASRDKAHLAEAMDRLESTVTLSVRLGAVAHELQKERGLSAGFIGSSGNRFGPELAAQQTEADKRILELQQAMQRIRHDPVDKDLKEILFWLEALGSQRQAISKLSQSGDEAFNYYSATIAAILKIPAELGSGAADGASAQIAASYGALLQAKEWLGRARAQLNNAASTDRFTLEAYNRFVSTSANHETFVKLFTGHAPEQYRVMLTQARTSQAMTEVDRMYTQALARGPGASLGIDPGHWFKAATHRIDVMKTIEDRLATDLQQVAARARHSAYREMLVFTGISLVCLLLTLYLAFVIIRGILHQLGGEPEVAVRVANSIADGNLENTIEIRAGDERSLLSAMKSMQQRLLDSITAERRHGQEMARIKVALDNVSTGVMIADTERRIIYANKAVTAILKTAETPLRQKLPDFQANHLLGINIDALHQNPDYQASLDQSHTDQLMIGDRHMTVTTNPVVDELGDRLGTVAEWTDRTSEVAVETEIQHIVSAAGRGDFSQRLDLSRKEGFFLALTRELNHILDTSARGLNDVAQVLNTLAGGDLTRRIETDYEGTFGQLKDDTNLTVERLREVVSQIKETSDAIDIAAKEIAAGNQDLSVRTEQQATSLEETAASMDELNRTVHQNADHARQANELARRSNALAVQGGEIVQQVVSTMGDIQGSSKKIADIVGLIDTIAFQTNILALNAAVEAARAGEQGRGFAVVASEVRSLAQRSAASAKEIKALITDSVAKVDGGVQLAQSAGRTMNEVVASFQQVTTLVTEIAHASREQSVGIEQVTRAVEQMDEVTQRNAALVEEAAAAAESLEEQAQALVDAVGSFKLN